MCVSIPYAASDATVVYCKERYSRFSGTPFTDQCPTVETVKSSWSVNKKICASFSVSV